jgi:hypothetical protein
MQSSIVTPPVGIAAEDVPDLAALVTGAAGPFATVIVSTGRDRPDQVAQVESLWRELRAGLSEQGAPESVLDRAWSAVDAARLDGDALGVVVADGVEPVVMVHDEAADDSATWDTLPSCSTFVEWAQSSPPGVLAVVDRTGADLFATGSEMPVQVVEGEDGPVVRRSAPGGWSQRRFQQRAEMAWEANAAEVADELGRLAADVGARVVVVAGDVRAVREVEQRLPDGVAELVRNASGGRGEGSEGHLEDDVRRWYRTAIADDTVAIVRKFDEEIGQQDRAVTGLAATVDALAMSAVDTLLVQRDVAAGTRIHLGGPDGTMPSMRGDDLEGSRSCPAVDALVAAAWATGARVRLVPSVASMHDGVGALLRFPLGR